MFHKEGYKIILASFFLTTLIVILTEQITSSYLRNGIQIITLIKFILILQFFRNPKRKTKINKENIISSVDGKVVIIKKFLKKNILKDERIQVSVFMSPLNVHVTRHPISGLVKFSKYHPGKYLVAWLPKSSELNERTTIVVNNEVFGDVMFRQIAGALARRIVNYSKEGLNVVQGTDAGFIKFGSRVDLFLPTDIKVNVQEGDKVKGGIDVIATI